MDVAGNSHVCRQRAKTLKFLQKLVAWPLLGLVWLYRNAVSPLLGANCRFQPTCSAYAAEALKRYGGFKGGWLVLKRIGRCHPWGGSGYDPVPESQEDGDESD
ncbi:MAG: membrane protein insertion efficiency factor YidD [Proteobacteria bacterium]|nr:membrane protein insertion efficiency factor YidD [Pseudomonadota bacterium]